MTKRQAAKLPRHDHPDYLYLPSETSNETYLTREQCLELGNSQLTLQSAQPHNRIARPKRAAEQSTAVQRLQPLGLILIQP